MKKAYLTDVIGEVYKNWANKKIFVAAPTGMGKTTFILEKLLSFHSAGNRKMLILCNRKLLRKQYLYCLAERFHSYTELTKCVNVMTYQQLAESVKNDSYREILAEYEVICLDECHYFYADSDFNGFGTYMLLQILIAECIRKQMIFMSATMEEVRPHIERVIEGCIRKTRESAQYERGECYTEILNYNFEMYADYSRVNCTCVPDIDTLCELLARTEDKSIVFLDDKRMAAQMYEKLTGKLNVGKTEIAVLNAENLDNCENSKVIENLVMINKLLPKILVTTSVLDNGVSVHDPDVRNVVIITESKTSFLQMLGRVRAESVDCLNLIFLWRESEVFSKRENRLGKIIEYVEDIQNTNYDRNKFKYLQEVWGNSVTELAEVYRKVLVLGKYEYPLFFEQDKKVSVQYGDMRLCLNRIAIEKIGEMYLTESRYHVLAMESPVKVIEEQMGWIGKTLEMLCIENSTYKERKSSDLRKELLRVQNFSLTELGEFKRNMTLKYRKELFADIVSKNGSFATDKLRQILVRYDLFLVENVSGDGTKRYSIVEKERD